jgi:hypothetical protein
MIARAHRQGMRFSGRQAGFQAAVDQQAPHLLVGDRADEVLDVDAAVAQRAPRFVRLRYLGGEGDDAFQARLDLWCLLNRAHGTRFLSLRSFNGPPAWLPCGQAHIVAGISARVGCSRADTGRPHV